MAMTPENHNKTGATSGRHLKIPLTNLYMHGDYTGTLYFGESRTAAQVILDTGSSTLVIDGRVYNPEIDPGASVTNLAQRVEYGAGGWTGAVVKTRMALGCEQTGLSLNDVHTAVTLDPGKRFFGQADGILGLAYGGLNQAFTLQGPSWPAIDADSLEQSPRCDLAPCFSQLEESGVIANKFAFYTQRSRIHYGGGSPEQNPFNYGCCIVGGGEEQTDFYQGDFKTVRVVHDLFYNTNLKSIRVAGQLPIPVQPPAAGGKLASNSIVDSGTNNLVLPEPLLNRILEQFRALDPGYAKLISQSMSHQHVRLTDTELAGWPDIVLCMEGEAEDVELRIKAVTYWQICANPEQGAVFCLSSSSFDFVILGLPLMNNYYCVFDRSADEGLGVVRFAEARSAQEMAG